VFLCFIWRDGVAEVHVHLGHVPSTTVLGFGSFQCIVELANDLCLANEAKAEALFIGFWCLSGLTAL
jgi:hypothetical protein